MSSTPSNPDASAPIERLISKEELKQRVTDMARSLEKEYGNVDSPLVLVSVLKGSAFFLADLMREMTLDIAVDFMSISSYSEGEHSGVVRIVKDLDTDVTDRDVLIVEDIVDTGLTLNYLRTTLAHRSPRSLKAVTLLDKVARRIVPVELEFSCFEAPDEFVIGYGLDFQGLYRNVPEIYSVRDLPRLVNDARLLVGPLFSDSNS